MLGEFLYTTQLTIHSPMQLHLKKFDMASIKDTSIVVLIGKRDTGKSWLVRDLLWHHKDIPVGTVISPTEAVNRFYADMVPSLFIHDKVNPELLASVVKRQKIITKRTHTSPNIDPRAFVVLDDCFYDNSWVSDVSMRYLFCNGRHVKTLVLITMQYPLGVPPSLRTNIDYVFILRENIVNNRKRIYDNYAGMFPNFDSFAQTMNQTTENYECLVIHNNSKSNRIEDQVFWYKAEEHNGFRMGAPEFWKWHEELCDEADDDDDDGEDMIDISKIRSKKGPILSVKKTLF
jgi:hypothetical protein